jgi:hypothetical protein
MHTVKIIILGIVEKHDMLFFSTLHSLITIGRLFVHDLGRRRQKLKEDV